MRRSQLNSYAVLLMLFVIGFLVLREPAAIGLDAGAAGTVFTLLPAGALVVVSIMGVLQSRGAMRFGAMICVGIGLSWMLYLAWVEGLVTVDMLTGLTIREAQVWTILLSVAFGAVVSR
jgi:hypothetical protein